jgi:hypothetical protein
MKMKFDKDKKLRLLTTLADTIKTKTPNDMAKYAQTFKGEDLKDLSSDDADVSNDNLEIIKERLKSKKR